MKRIITCSDGTWNKTGSKDKGAVVSTNVEKMFNSICRKQKTGNPTETILQLKVYDEGIGTGYSWKDKILGGVSGAGIDKNIKDMYSFLMVNYEPGDEIYLFGFSRGAYTARSIAGLIRNCGILKPEYMHIVDQAYNLYRDRNLYTTPDSDLMRGFRFRYCHEDVTPIHFIGVWDTVGSLGIPLPWYKLRNRDKYRFHDVTLSSTVKYAYHALAIDEKRVLFSPTLWEKSSSAVNDPKCFQKIEQRWFAGVHSNIGGGYVDSGLSNIALEWLIAKAEEAGLCFNDPPLIKVNPEYDMGLLRNSYSPFYWFWLPRCRKIDLNDDTQTIDPSVWKRYHDPMKKYKPKSLVKWCPKDSAIRLRPA